MFSWCTVQTRALTVSGWAVAALGFSLPVSTTLDGILLVIAIVAWAISGSFKDLPQMVHRNQLILLLPSLFVLVALGMTHGLVPFSERTKYLWKYNDFLLPFLFIPLFINPRVRELGLWAFGGSMALTLVLSLCVAAAWIGPGSWLHGIQANATVFKHQVTHNLLMAFAAFLFAGVAIKQNVPWRRYGLGLLALTAVIDVFMFVQGRTGQVVLSALIILWCERRFGFRGLFVGVAAVSILVVFSYAVSPVFQKRVEKTATELRQAQVGPVVPVGGGPSVGLRVEWYKNTVHLIAGHPFAGVGTGSFAQAYAELVTEPVAAKPAHPHNQYLLTAAEIGVAGALVLPGLFAILWWKVRRIDAPMYGDLGQGVVIVLVISCVFNSSFLDHTEGLFFAWMISAVLAAEDQRLIGGGC